MGKKKIDELFQERLKDFEQVPDKSVWEAIEASLEKKKRKVIPLWWKLGGVAAVLAIAFLAINPFAAATDSAPAVSTVEQENLDSLNHRKTRQEKMLNTKKSNETQLTDVNSKKVINNAVQKRETDSTQKNLESPTQNFKYKSRKINRQAEQLTGTKEEPTLHKGNKIVPKQKSKVVENITEKRDLIKNGANHIKQTIPEVVVQQTDSLKSSSQKRAAQAIANDNTEKYKNRGGDNLPTDFKKRGVVLDDGVAQAQKTNSDSLPKKKSIHDEIIEQEEALAESDVKNRWSAGPSIAPVYYDAFGKGSPVHSILVPNSKSGNTNLSYGLSVAYEINNRLSVRSGIHKVDYGYDTGEIAFSSSLDGFITDQMDNIDYASTARNLVVKSNAGTIPVGVNNQDDTSVDALVNSNTRNGSMSQQFGYLEVPLELNYALVDKRIGINLIGGFSSLFLIDNAVSLTDGNQTTQMGEANNVNDLNFSTNIGLGIDYNFTSKIKLNIEPVFKYQLNTFSQVDGSFNPFTVGIYSGVTFRF